MAKVTNIKPVKRLLIDKLTSKEIGNVSLTDPDRDVAGLEQSGRVSRVASAVDPGAGGVGWRVRKAHVNPYHHKSEEKLRESLPKPVPKLAKHGEN